MSQVRHLQKNRFRRDAWLEINLDNLEFNLKTLHAEFNKPLLPVVKADAYGHGAAVITKILDAYKFIYGYGVANVDEALNLRETSSNKIIILGICPNWALEQVIENDIDLTVCDLNFAQDLNKTAAALNKVAKIHIKIDSGMNRIGFKNNSPTEFEKLIKEIENLGNLKIESIFTHFAEPSDIEFCKKQYEIFSKLSQNLPYPKHPVSSTSARTLAGIDFDIIRCGIELYGLENPKLKPLLSLYSRVSFVKDIEANESVSYKRTWSSKTQSQIATLPLGYADGVPRALSNKIQAYYKDNFFDQVGLITMDQMMINIGLESGIKAGDIIELIGPHIPIQTWAEKANTISYEIATNLNLRLPKSYTR